MLKWIDGAEIWADSIYQQRSYAQGTTGFSTANPRVAPGIRSLLFNPSDFLTTPSLGEQNTWIVGFGLRMTDSSPIGWSWRFLDAGVEQCRLELVDNGSTFDLALKRGATTIETTAQAFAYGIWHHFELKITVRGSTNGSYELRHNEINVMDGTGVNLADSGQDGCDAHSFGHTTGASTHLMDDINIKDNQGGVNDDFVGDAVCKGLLPTSDGASAQFTPSTGVQHFSLVDDPATAASSADYVASDTNGHKDLYGFEDLPATGLGSIFGVKVSVAAAMAAVGNRTLRTKFRNGGGSEANGDDFVVDGTTVLEHPTIMDVNPVSAAAWTKSDIDNGQFGVEVVS